MLSNIDCRCCYAYFCSITLRQYFDICYDIFHALFWDKEWRCSSICWNISLERGKKTKFIIANKKKLFIRAYFACKTLQSKERQLLYERLDLLKRNARNVRFTHLNFFKFWLAAHNEDNEERQKRIRFLSKTFCNISHGTGTMFSAL